MASVERTPTVGIVVLRQKQVLLVEHGEAASHITGTIGLPGGRLEEGEEPVLAAQRELEEETGLIAQTLDLYKLPKIYRASFDRKDGSVLHAEHTVFVCTSFRGEISGSDETTPMWIGIRHLPKMNLMIHTQDIVADAINFLKHE